MKTDHPHTNSLFSEEELQKSDPLMMQAKQNEPVVCLGMTFESDEARREYFRDELRKKLPELKKIEGFPIGEDEDVINLSDPPYYTACPNPWLNDFIEEWEKEKEQLTAEGKRSDDFEVKEPYSYGIKQGKNSAIYNAHSYHTKVPHEIIMRYILHYTQPGDIILDGFAGTGMTGVAATACENPSLIDRKNIEADFSVNKGSKPRWGKRHAICGDLSPLCYHIAANYNSKVNTVALSNAAKEIISRLEQRFGHFYKLELNKNGIEEKYHINYFVWSEVVACKNCGAELNVHNLSFNYKTQTLTKALTCPYCSTTQKKTEASPIWETVYDNNLKRPIQKIKYVCSLVNYSITKGKRAFSKEIPSPKYPSYTGYTPQYEIDKGDKFGDPKRVGIKVVGQLYYERTRYVLAYLYDLIVSEYAQLKQPLMFIFTSMLPKLTRMNRYMPQHGSRALVGPMANTMYIPPQGVENNPIDQFEYQARKVIKAFSECKSGSVIQICSATTSSTPDNSIDYIFTDPPFGANIMYSELNSVSESWIKVMTNNKEEAISNKTQKKSITEYQEIITQCFREYFRILKPGHWMTVEFSNTSASYWNSLQYAIKNAGFFISTITDLNKERGGLHAMLGPVAVKQDLAISCYKPSEKVMTQLDNSLEEMSVWGVMTEMLEHLPIHIAKANKTTEIIERNPKILYDRLISYYVQHGYPVPLDAREFQAGLRERYKEIDGMFFTYEQAAEYLEKKKLAPEMAPLGLIVSDEANGIQWLRNELVKPQTYQDIQPKWMQAIGAVRKNDIIPELKQLLEENFIEEDGGEWRLPNIQDDKDLEALRTKALLREFKLYVEAVDKPKSKIKEARVEALRAGFKQCYVDKDFETIVRVGNKIPQNLRDEDEVLLQFYDIALNKM